MNREPEGPEEQIRRHALAIHCISREHGIPYVAIYGIGDKSTEIACLNNCKPEPLSPMVAHVAFMLRHSGLEPEEGGG